MNTVACGTRRPATGRVVILPDSVDLRFRRRPRAHQHVEVAALVGLGDVVGVDGAEAALELAGRRDPGGAPGVELGLGHVEVQSSAGDVQLRSEEHTSELPSLMRTSYAV